MKRHKWIKNAVPPDEILIEATYQLDKCERCGCLCLHKCFGRFDFEKVYIVNGKESKIRPDCTK